nr:MAG TPA: major capsid protein [Caudoviricetes sp.]
MAELESVYAKQYGANVYTLAQQKGSVLRPYVTLEDMKGEKRHFDRVKPTTAVRLDSKYGDTPLIPTEFDRRTVHAKEYVWADMVDWQDDLNVFIDPCSNIVRMGGYALGRIIDDVIIGNALDGIAYEGKEGLTQVGFPAAQQISITTDGTGNTGLNIEKLIQARSMFGKADIDLDDPENELIIAVTQAQLDDLLKGVDVANRLYEAMRDLYTGRTNRFLGFTFVRCNRLSKSVSGEGYSRKCAAWCKSGVVLCVPQEITMSVKQRPDKNDNWQALAKLKCGATRIEDAKVVQIFCQES